jgi:hypothetical protein
MSKLRLLTLLTFCTCLFSTTYAQKEAVTYDGEFGLTLGVAHYFGDLNTRAALNRPKPALGAFFRKQFGNYVALRAAVHYAHVGYSDIYSSNEFQKRRNLSFNSDIWEFGLMGDFNFFKFVPGEPGYQFTPYVTLGLGVFSYDPYAYLNSTKYFLRPLGTEGQGSTTYPDKKPYKTLAMCFPIGMGIKYNINRNLNFSLEVTYRYTSTDYLDDVSGTYAGPAPFPPLPNGQPSAAFLLQDRSYETGIPIGTEGTQRGFSGQKDSYIIFEAGIAFTLSSYHCPSAK